MKFYEIITVQGNSDSNNVWHVPGKIKLLNMAEGFVIVEREGRCHYFNASQIKLIVEYDDKPVWWQDE